jgi:hypothetical protein
MTLAEEAGLIIFKCIVKLGLGYLATHVFIGEKSD